MVKLASILSIFAFTATLSASESAATTEEAENLENASDHASGEKVARQWYGNDYGNNYYRRQWYGNGYGNTYYRRQWYGNGYGNGNNYYRRQWYGDYNPGHGNTYYRRQWYDGHNDYGHGHDNYY